MCVADRCGSGPTTAALRFVVVFSSQEIRTAPATREHDPAQHAPAARPFAQDLQLGLFAFPGGLERAYHTARGGAFGKVVVGEWVDGVGKVAVKILLSDGTSREVLPSPAVRQLEALNAQLTLTDRGARHVAYMYGTGYEPSLALLHAGLPSRDAHLIALEPLEQTLTEFQERRARIVTRPDSAAATAPAAPAQPPAIEELVRIARDVALGLTFLGHLEVVVSCNC